MPRPAKVRDEDDAEACAHVLISRAMRPLDDAALQRTVKWVVEKYHKAQSGKTTGTTSALEILQPPKPETGDLPTFFQKCNPSTYGEKILVAAYYHQEVQGLKEWDSRAVNRDLKQLGHKVPRIVEYIERLAEKSPALVIQTKKEGTTKQARKKYRVTDEGMSEVRALLAKAS